MPNPGKEKLTQLYYLEDKRLQEIGDKYNVTRERVRQWMENLNIPRTKKRKHTSFKIPEYKSLEDYFQAVKNGRKESISILFRFTLALKTQCEECGSIENLHIHHKKYPAISLDDIQILCASCHHAKHRKGNGHKIQLEICVKYIKGKNGIELAKEYKVTKMIIYNILHKWNIKIRSRGRLTKNFNKGDLTT